MTQAQGGSLPAGQSSPAPPASGRRGRRLLKHAIYALLIGIVFYFVGRSLIQCFRRIEWQTLHVNALFLILALAALCCHRLFTGLICNMLLHAFGRSIGYVRATGIIWTSAMGRYVPGKMAAVAGATLLLVRAGIPLPMALAALFLSTALTILICLLIAAPMFLLPSVREQLPWAWVPAAGIIALGLVSLHPRVFIFLCNALLRALRRPPLPSGLRVGPFLAAIAFITLRCCFLGLSIWLTARAILPLGISQYPLVLGSATLAAAGGFLAVFVPAGLGVQEAIYLMTLGPILGPEVGLVALLFRLLQVVIDALTGLTGVTLLRARGPSDAAGPDLPASPLPVD